jgi:hypothetical protein
MTLQRQSNGSTVGGPVFPVVQDVLRSPGRPLDPDTRAFMEARFGRDFSQVRLHTDVEAARAANELNARAYTVGSHIAFGANWYSPQTKAGRHLLAHELAHTLQQRTGENSRLAVADSPELEREADCTAGAFDSEGVIPTLKPLHPASIARQKLGPDEPLRIERNFELDPQRFLKPMEASAPKEEEKCEEFPGGSTDCDVDQSTGIPTGKVTQRIDEKNPCTRTCVEQHEGVHVKQMRTFCPTLRDCYLAADKGKRPASECMKMAIFGMKERECEAYKVSLPCVERRLKNAKECQSNENKDYGTRKLASERCFRDRNCGGSSGT